MHTVAENLSFVNLLLALIVFVWLIARRIQHPDWYPRGGLRRDIWAMGFCWILAIIVDSIEQLFTDAINVRVIVIMAAIFTTIAILVRPAEDWTNQSTSR